MLTAPKGRPQKRRSSGNADNEVDSGLWLELLTRELHKT